MVDSEERKLDFEFHKADKSWGLHNSSNVDSEAACATGGVPLPGSRRLIVDVYCECQGRETAMDSARPSRFRIVRWMHRKPQETKYRHS